MKEYDDFLRSKVKLAQPCGVALDAGEINPALKPHQAAMVRWLVKGGRRACFAAFGLGKSVIQLETVRLVLSKTGGRALIVCPLGVRQEFAKDAVEILGWETPPCFIRRIEEAGPAGVYLTNYESVRDGKLDPRLFAVASLDEASILRGFGGSKTFREFMRLFTGDDGPKAGDGVRTKGASAIPYRFVATATPSPNDYIELLAYADFLGVMDISQAKTRFFKRDSTKADKLTLHKHKEREFWLWMASWALFVQKPSDLGFSDVGYDLPPLDVRWHEVPTDHHGAGVERSGQHKMFRDAAIGLQDAAAEKRLSLPTRIEKLLEIRAEDPGAHRIIWHDLEREREAIEAALPSERVGHWLTFKDGHEVGLALYERHYSAHQYADGRERKLFCGPGHKTVLLTENQDALFVWRKFIDDSGQTGINCAVFRNEGMVRSSTLIREAMTIAWQRWPGERLYTYVDAKKIRSTNPGACFKKAGWKDVGKTKGGLRILEVLPEVKGSSISSVPVMRSVYGTQDLEEREEAIAAFSRGEFQELATKPVLCGSGCNFQRHCAWAVFLGIGFKFNDFIQAIHRLQRFLQTRPVRIDIIYTEAEREVRKQLERKWTQHNQMVYNMATIIKEFGLSQAAMAKTLTRKLGVERVEVTGRGYRLVNNDCVLETARLAENSLGLCLTSWPFSTQYEYSPSYNDFGHNDGNKDFFEQMDFLTPEIYRALMPGRIYAVHVKDRIVPGGMTGLGFQTVYPFHMHCIQHCIKHGFGYMGMKTVVTDVVRENNQTYRLGWTEQCKDGSKMGVGMPEYLLLFRKPPTSGEKSYADVPVVKEKSKYSLARWQVDAHGFTRSSGDRLLTPEELTNLPHSDIFKLFRQHSLEAVYDFEHHVRIGEEMEQTGRLPVTFMLLQPQSWSDEVWTDITRMLTLNGAQSAAGKEMHLCPMQFDLADRVIEQFSMEGETVFDPFGGLMTVPYRAILQRRHGVGFELNPAYFTDGVAYCRAAAEEMAMPALFDLEACGAEREVAA